MSLRRQTVKAEQDPHLLDLLGNVGPRLPRREYLLRLLGFTTLYALVGFSPLIVNRV
jgi:hypothetical protein